MLLTPLLTAQSPQPCVVELFIGDPEFFAGDGGPAIDAKFSPLLFGVAAATDSSVLVIDFYNYRIRSIDTQGTITTMAGSGIRGLGGDGGPAVAAQLSDPRYLAPAPDGSLYFIDDALHRIRRVSPDGDMETVYLNSLGHIDGVTVSSDGTVYFPMALTSPKLLRGVYRLEGDGSATLVAGGGAVTTEPTTDGIPALDYVFQYAHAVLARADGDLLVIDRNWVLRIDTDGMIYALVGGGEGSFQNGSLPLDTVLRSPKELAENGDGDLHIGGTSNGLLVLRDGLVSQVDVGVIRNIASAPTGIVMVKDRQIARLSEGDVVEPIAGIDRTGYLDPGLPLNQSHVGSPSRMLTDSQGRLIYVASPGTMAYRTALDGTIEVIAGGGDLAAGDGVLATDAKLGAIHDIGIDSQDRLYLKTGFSSGLNPLLLRVESNGTFTVRIGPGFIDNPSNYTEAPAADIRLHYVQTPIGVTPDGVVYFEWFRNQVFKLGLDNIARRIPFGVSNGPDFMGVDTQGRVMLSSDKEFVIYDDVESPPTTYFGAGVSDAATTANGTAFAISNREVLRATPDGRQTSMFPRGAGFHFANGEVPQNADLVSPTAVATNTGGDLFVADSGLDRVFVIRKADTCMMERPYVLATLNGANYASGEGSFGFAPGDIVTAFGDFLGPVALAFGAPNQSINGTWQTIVSSFEVLVDRTPAPVIFTRSDQAAFIIPNEVEGTARIQYRLNGVESSVVTISVRKANPGIFTANSSGGGQAAALNQDSSVNSSSNPAEAGSVIVLYVTGAGATDPPTQTGSLNSFPLPQLVETVEVLIDGQPTVVEFAGPAPGLVSGVFQINARIPAGTSLGAKEVEVKIGGTSSSKSPAGQWPTIAVK